MTCAEMQLCVEAVPIPMSVWRLPNVWKKGLNYEIKRRVRSFIYNTLDQNRAYKLLKYLNNKYKSYLKQKEQEVIANEKIVAERKVQEAIFKHEQEIQKQRYEREQEMKDRIMKAKELDNKNKTALSIMAKFIEEQQRELAASSVNIRKVESETYVVDEHLEKTSESFIEQDELQAPLFPLFPVGGCDQNDEESFPSFSSYNSQPLEFKTPKQIRVESAIAAIDTRNRLKLPAGVFSDSYISKAGGRPTYKFEDEKYYYVGRGVWRSGDNQLVMPLPLNRAPGPIAVKPYRKIINAAKEPVSDIINYNDFLDHETRSPSLLPSRSQYYQELSSDDDNLRDDHRIIYASDDDDSQLLSDTDEEVSDELCDININLGPKVIYADTSDSDSQYLSD